MQPKNKLHCSNSLIAAMEIARNTWQEMTLYIVAIRFVNTLVVVHKLANTPITMYDCI